MLALWFFSFGLGNHGICAEIPWKRMTEAASSMRVALGVNPEASSAALSAAASRAVLGRPASINVDLSLAANIP